LFRVHYICMDKKKKLQNQPEEIDETSTTEETSKDTPTFVTEVVEEVEENNGSGESSVEENENSQEEIASEKEEIEEMEPSPEYEKYEKKQFLDEEPHPEQSKKQMVEDIFSSKQTNNLVDIAINKKQPTQPAIVWAIIIIIVALVTGGAMILLTKTMGEKKETAAKPTPTVAQVSTPTPTAAAIKRSDLKIQVLNGGGKAGAGSKMKTFLTDLGYTVSAVGNTDEYTFEKTEIEVAAGKEGALELLRNDLAKDYSLGTMSATLAAGSPYDARVTVGK
jgi:hypothetical protein